MDQEIEVLRRSAAAGWVPSRDVLQRVLAQIDSQLVADAIVSPYDQPFKRLGRDIPLSEQPALQQCGLQAVAEQVLPALRRLRALVADELQASAPADGSLRGYPQGDAVYTMHVRQQTSTSLTPAQIHALGQRELVRLCGDRDAKLWASRSACPPICIRDSAICKGRPFAPRRAAGRRHRQPGPGRVAPADDRLHGRAHRRQPRICRQRD